MSETKELRDYQFFQGELMHIDTNTFDPKKQVFLQQLLGSNSAIHFGRHHTFLWVIGSVCGAWIGGWVIRNHARYNFKVFKEALPDRGGEDEKVMLEHAHVIWDHPPVRS